MNQKNNNNQLENLLKTAAARLGTTPEALKKAAQNGDLSRAMGNANSQDTAAMNKVLNDPEAAKKLMNSEQAQKLMKMFQDQNGK